MGIAEDFREHLFNLDCLSKASARRKFRREIKYAWGGLCAYCCENKATSLDHVKPRSRGGSDLRSNLVPACLGCQQSKGCHPNWLEWYQTQNFYSAVRAEMIEDHITNKRLFEDADDEQRIESRTALRTAEVPLRGEADEPPSLGTHSIEAAA